MKIQPEVLHCSISWSGRQRSKQFQRNEMPLYPERKTLGSQPADCKDLYILTMMFQPLDTEQPNELPRTVEEAVTILFEDLLLKDRVILAKLSEKELDSTVYLALAKSIRKEFGLFNGNDHLITSCQRYLGREYDSFEDPAMVIIKELWKKIRAKHHLRLVKN